MIEFRPMATDSTVPHTGDNDRAEAHSPQPTAEAQGPGPTAEAKPTEHNKATEEEPVCPH